MSITEQIAATHLGKKSAGSEYYDKSLLVAVPRVENRQQYDIEEDKLPFVGCDVWNAYEFSSMTDRGIPYTRVLKLRYPCNNPVIVESKSLKLYLNSFNMSRFGRTVEEGLSICKDIIERDLSEKLQTRVEAEFLNTESPRAAIFSDYQELSTLTNYLEIENITKFKEAPEDLRIDVSRTSATPVAHKLSFDSLRSTCLITKQPDFARVFIYYKSKKLIDEKSLIQYLVSFRNEHHFHEQVVEMMFSRLHTLLDDPEDQLMIVALYTRRGGIDINPVRYTANCDLGVLVDVTKLENLKLYTRGNICQ